MQVAGDREHVRQAVPVWSVQIPDGDGKCSRGERCGRTGGDGLVDARGCVYADARQRARRRGARWELVSRVGGATRRGVRGSLIECLAGRAIGEAPERVHRSTRAIGGAGEGHPRRGTRVDEGAEVQVLVRGRYSFVLLLDAS